MLEVVDGRKFFPEHDFHEHEPQSKDVCLEGVAAWHGSVLGEGDHLLGREVNSLDHSLVENLLVVPVDWQLADYAPAHVVADAAVGDAERAVVQGHFGDAADDREQVGQVGRTEVLEEGEIGEDEVFGQHQVVDRGGVGGFLGVALGDVEVHAFVAHALQGSVDGTSWIGELLLRVVSNSHCARCSSTFLI